MIKLKRLNDTDFFLNPELIEQIEGAPDTVITLTTGNNFVVKDKVQDVVDKILDYRKKITGQELDRREKLTEA